MATDLHRCLALALCLTASGAWAYRTPTINNENVAQPGPWQEGAVPPAPAFSTSQLLPLEMPSRMSVRIGIDPATLSVGADGVVRYVAVIVNQSGSVMASYEGLRCDTREVRTYERQYSDGKWSPVSNAAWQSVDDNMPSHHARTFAEEAACMSGSAQSVQNIIQSLKKGKPNPLDIIKGN